LDRTYTGSYGRLKVSFGDFLSNQFLTGLISRDLEGIEVALSETSYREDIEQLASLYKPPELLDFAVNRHLIKKNRLAQFSPPPNARPFLKAYFLKWDIENIKSIISSKTLGYQAAESESFLIGFRNLPLGILAGTMTQEDFRIMISLGSVDAVIDYLTRYGIGTYLLVHMEEYRKTKDVTSLYSAMDSYHFTSMLDSLKFYNGDESNIRDYIRETIDSYNILSVLKATQLSVPLEQVSRFLFARGNIPISVIEESMRMQSIEEAAAHFKQYYDLTSASEKYSRSGLLYHYEIEMRSTIISKYATKMSALPVSLNSIFYFIIKAEVERENLRAIIAGKLYNLSDERIRELLILV